MSTFGGQAITHVMTIRINISTG